MMISYMKQDDQAIYLYDSPYNLKIKSLSNSLKRLYLTNKKGETVFIPDDFILQDDCGYNLKRLNNSFYINWYVDYSLYYDNKILCKIKNQKIYRVYI
jgi:hypothetical protein